jgi:polyhydroxybutyrate depolymerase
VFVALTAIVGAGCADSAPAAQSASSSSSSGAVDPQFTPGTHDVSFDVGGTIRTAELVLPDDLSHPAPLVFAFHGHGGSGANFDRTVDIDGLWPDAIVIYPDGLPGHKGITDEEGVKPGWQTDVGELGDRDLHFYDTMLASLRANLPVDNSRIYVVGHSNGSLFTGLLLNQRGDDIAATANLSGPPQQYLATDPVRSMFMSMGMTDPLIPFDRAKLAIPRAQDKLGIDQSTATTDGLLTTATDTQGGTELATYVYPGGHAVPAEVPPLVVAFFQRHTLAAT